MIAGLSRGRSRGTFALRLVSYNAVATRTLRGRDRLSR
jgi:hypothetical protein